MKKIKTIEAVAAYRTLKALKTSSMSDDAAMRVWKNMKALRHVADTYDKDVEEAQVLAFTRNATLYDDTKIIFISPPGAISFKYYPRQIYMESIKSGSSGFVDFSSLRELFGGSCICKARIYKLPDGIFTITDGIFRSVAAYGNNKITYGRGYVSNSSGQGTSSVTIPEGDRTDYVEVYIRFDNVYEGGYYGQMCQLSFEINIDGRWKQVPPGGIYIMR